MTGTIYNTWHILWYHVFPQDGSSICQCPGYSCPSPYTVTLSSRLVWVCFVLFCSLTIHSRGPPSTPSPIVSPGLPALPAQLPFHFNGPRWCTPSLESGRHHEISHVRIGGRGGGGFPGKSSPLLVRPHVGAGALSVSTPAVMRRAARRVRQFFLVLSRAQTFVPMHLQCEPISLEYA